ncbi:hypothetical protein [Paraburkholderia piptadeniae]|uniref:hypothetical protein n=1 Tax=Paraburkholderia piptadeniae TaxID=1701573 RepID=UPI00135AF930|nr:hypothetical protein [Paraburkholderia piptadeniae]
MSERSAKFADWIVAALIAVAIGAIAGHESFSADSRKQAPQEARGIQTKMERLNT